MLEAAKARPETPSPIEWQSTNSSAAQVMEKKMGATITCIGIIGGYFGVLLG